MSVRFPSTRFAVASIAGSLPSSRQPRVEGLRPRPEGDNDMGRRERDSHQASCDASRLCHCPGCLRLRCLPPCACCPSRIAEPTQAHGCDGWPDSFLSARGRDCSGRIWPLQLGWLVRRQTSSRVRAGAQNLTRLLEWPMDVLCCCCCCYCDGKTMDTLCCEKTVLPCLSSAQRTTDKRKRRRGNWNRGLWWSLGREGQTNR
ncbi:hypothetical protein B0T18DRAFT_68836 [Schizothecium vesticola]|uniref:Uncharacterized protein n=1 Tax=Schizothecium vesticola TaxID=314040 RepID=A0AA40KAG9_9PEZI|nr:hypothetical protein B0T18DRAFT_68836 [Schizothecium vesticola]